MANRDLVDRVLDALVVAKKAHALLPPLPEGMRPVHVRVLRALHKLGGDGARVSDINGVLGASLPNTTRFIGELEALGVVEKVSTEADRRVVLIRATPRGARYTAEFVERLHAQMAEAFQGVGERECLRMAETLDAIHRAMQELCREREPAPKPSRRDRKGGGRRGGG